MRRNPPLVAPQALPRVTSLAERLRGAREHGFVGRAAEMAAFRRMLLDPTHSLLFVRGQVGVGKSALLQQYLCMAQTNGHRAVLLDAHQILDMPVVARAAQRDRLLTELEPSKGVDRNARSVLLVDGFESVRASHDWLLSDVAPALAEDVLLVFASRCEAPAAITLDPAWSRLRLDRELLPLSAEEGAIFLHQRGVPQSAHGGIAELAGGFPLALVVAADLVMRSLPSTSSLDSLEGAQHALARMLCPLSVSPGQQLALDLSALARTTTAEIIEFVCQRLSAELLGESLDLYNWLAHQSFMEWTPEGLRPHALLRVAMSSRLRLERPRRHRAIMLSLREFAVTALEVGANPGADVVNLFFLDRDVPLVRRWTPPLAHEPVHPLEAAVSQDHAEITELVARLEGPASEALVTEYLTRDDCHFEVVRRRGIAGLVQYMRFNRDVGPDRLPDQDPVSLLIRRFMLESQLEGDEESLLVRSFLDARDYQTPTARVLGIIGRLSQLVLAERQMPYSFCVFRTPSEWSGLWKDLALPWQVVGKFRVGEHEYSLVVFLWRQRALREILVQPFHQPRPDAIAQNATPSFDELKAKVSDRVANLARKVKLTPRELEILEQLCLGSSLEAIARTLSIRPRTVKFHQENLLRKTGANSRVELFRKLL